MHILAVGDIHCKGWIIDKVELIVDKYDLIVFIGDIIDDWQATPQDSVDTAKKLYLLYEKHPNKIIVLKSNHDLPIFYKQARGQIAGISASNYLLWDIPENKYLVDWFESMPVIVQICGVLYSHAGLTNSFESWVSNANNVSDRDSIINAINNLHYSYLQSYPDSPLWARPRENMFSRWINGQVFGHTPSKTCGAVHDNIWAIDTFSTNRDGSLIGDETVLEIENGVNFKKIKLKR